MCRTILQSKSLGYTAFSMDRRITYYQMNLLLITFQSEKIGTEEKGAQTKIWLLNSCGQVKARSFQLDLSLARSQAAVAPRCQYYLRFIKHALDALVNRRVGKGEVISKVLLLMKYFIASDVTLDISNEISALCIGWIIWDFYSLKPLRVDIFSTYWKLPESHKNLPLRDASSSLHWLTYAS